MNLFNYQKRTIRWLVNKESETNSFECNTKNISFGDISYNSITNNLIDNKSNYLQFYGGLLTDEIGLGKTCQMICLCMINMAKKEMDK